MVPQKKRVLVPPDGGWGWMVVFGCALTNSFNQALLSVFGLMFGDKLNEMSQGTFGAALVANVMLLVTSFSGFFIGPALKKFSARKVSIAGSLLASFGMITASFSTQVWHLIVTYSLFTGFGVGIIQPASFIAVNSYFKSKKGRAIGISMAGTGIGQMLMPQLVQFLLDRYGFHGAAMIMGALALNGVVGSALFQPVKWHLVPENDTIMPLLSGKQSKTNNPNERKEQPSNNWISFKKESKSSAGFAKSLPFVNTKQNDKRRRNSICVASFTTDMYSDVGSIKVKNSKGIWITIKNLLDLDLLMNYSFISIILACGLGFTSNQNFNMLFPFFLQQAVGFTRPETAMCMSMLAALDTVARLSVPFFTDYYRISSKVCYFTGCITLTLSRILMVYQSSYIGILLTSALCGFFRSSIVINQNLIVSEYCNSAEDKLPAALGLNMVMKGVVIITLGQFLGWIRDFTGSYIICIHAQNSLLLLVVLMWTPEFLYKKYLSKSR